MWSQIVTGSHPYLETSECTLYMCLSSTHTYWGICNVNPAASRRFPMLIRQVQNVIEFFLWMLFQWHHCSHNVLILTCVCTMQSMGVGMFHRPLLKAVTHHWSIVPYMWSFLQVYNKTPLWLKLFNMGHGYILEWVCKVHNIYTIFPGTNEHSPSSAFKILIS